MGASRAITILASVVAWLHPIAALSAMADGKLGELAPVHKGRAVVAVIGVNDYSDWPRLDNALPDAMGIHEILVDGFGFEHETSRFDKAVLVHATAGE